MTRNDGDHSAQERSLLDSFGVRAEALLGRGGEASVYAIDEERVLRVLHDARGASTLQDRQALVDELGGRGAPFSLPHVIDVGEVDGVTYAVERRLTGTSVIEVLRSLEGNPRARLIEAHLDAAASLGDLHLEPRGWFGDLITRDPIRTSTWGEYLDARAAWSLQSSSPELRVLDAAALAAELPEPDQPAFVHLDAFAGNMLAVDGLISAVLDIGVTSVVGDRHLDPLSAVVYLASPEITGVTSPRDLDVAMNWLRSADLDDLYEPTRRWIAAYWAFAVDDEQLHAWCRSVLLTRSGSG